MPFPTSADYAALVALTTAKLQRATADLGAGAAAPYLPLPDGRLPPAVRDMGVGGVFRLGDLLGLDAPARFVDAANGYYEALRGASPQYRAILDAPGVEAGEDQAWRW